MSQKRRSDQHTGVEGGLHIQPTLFQPAGRIESEGASDPEHIGLLLTDCADDLFVRLAQIENEISNSGRQVSCSQEQMLPGAIQESISALERESDRYVEFDGRNAYHQWLSSLDAEETRMSELVRKWLMGLPRAIPLDSQHRVEAIVDGLCGCLTHLSLRLQDMLPAETNARESTGLCLTMSSPNSGSIAVLGGSALQNLGELVDECLELGGGFKPAEVRELRGAVLPALARRELVIPGFSEHSEGVFYLTRRRSQARVLEPAESFPGEEDVARLFPELHDDLEALVCLVHELGAVDPTFVAQRLERLESDLPEKASCFMATLRHLRGTLRWEHGNRQEMAAR